MKRVGAVREQHPALVQNFIYVAKCMAFPSTKLLQFMSKLMNLFYELFIDKFNIIFMANLQKYKNSNLPASHTEKSAVNDSSWINLCCHTRPYAGL
jgi:hypothetical protein